MRAVNASHYRRVRAVAALSVATVALAACGSDGSANQLGYDGGVAPRDEGGLTTLEAIALFGLVPLGLLLLVAALVWLPGMVRGNRYRPNKGWTAAPLWFGGPPDPAAAVETAQAGELVRGGASGSW
ncbi:MAG: hypothetical protein JWN08_1080 [Frankiales bacterium]|nr:hypothetical protein [Frankiales bacterium]